MEDIKKLIQNIRKDFEHEHLHELHLPENPFDSFVQWITEAINQKVAECTAMVISTANNNIQPSSRIVYLRDYEHNIFTFYCNYLSKKSQDIESNPKVSLLFYWAPLQRQIRIQGVAKKTSVKKSDEYFATRPYENQIGAWASVQSSKLNSREDLMKQFEYYSQQYPNYPVSRPEHWGGWDIEANYYEFWQGRPSRLHDRIAYEKTNNVWIKTRLSP